MRRALELGRTPGPSLPLRFLLTAPWFGVAAGLLLAWHGGDALASRWSGITLAMVHLLTLGFLSMTMAGSLLQMLPVVAGLPLRGERLGRCSCPLLAAGTVLLALAFATGAAPLFAAAAATLAGAFALLLGCLLPTVWRRDGAPASMLHIVRGMRSAAAMLAATVCAGLALAAWLAGGPAMPALALTDVHAGLGLVGWVTLLVAAVSFQVLPMFQGTSPYPAPVVRWLVPALALALAAWAAARWFDAPWRDAFGMAGAAGTAAWIAAGWRLLARRRSTPDPTTAHWRLALASLAAACVFAWPGPAGDARTLFTGVAFLVGFAMTVVDAMLVKIVPFLLWYHMQERAAPGTRVPKAIELVPASRIRAQFRCHSAAVGLGMLACWMPVLAKPAGLMLVADCLLLAASLSAPLLRHRRLLYLQPS
ncbi:permease [Massilia aerilata]|uniref:Permease n=1 Tax=Massilia aerilata TaxID=453817 RepID=A0ABW0RYQ6_9BURK